MNFRLPTLVAALCVAACTNPPAPTATTAVVQVLSTPPGAKVVFDGKELDGVTPMELRAVKAFDAHDIEVRLPGQPAWTKRFAPAAGVKTVLRAEFPNAAAAPGETPPPGAEAPAPAADAGADAPAAAAPPAAEAVAAPPVPAEAAADDAGLDDAGTIDPLHSTWPVTDVDIDGKLSALWIPEAGGVVVNFLKPNKSYRVWTEGVAGTRKGESSANVSYFIEGEQVWQDETYGTLGITPKVIKGARKMWLFAFDDDLSDNTGSLRVYIQESKLVAPTKVVWDPKRKEDLIFPDPEKLWKLDGLNPNRTYTFGAEMVELAMREPPWGRLQYMICRMDGEGPARFEVIWAAHGSHTFSGAKRIVCFFPDASLEPNSGRMVLNFLNHP